MTNLYIIYKYISQGPQNVQPCGVIVWEKSSFLSRGGVNVCATLVFH